METPDDGLFALFPLPLEEAIALDITMMFSVSFSSCKITFGSWEKLLSTFVELLSLNDNLEY